MATCAVLEHTNVSASLVLVLLVTGHGCGGTRQEPVAAEVDPATTSGAVSYEFIVNEGHEEAELPENQ